MSRLSLMDLAFFLTESAASPKHVAGLMVFRRPAGSKPGWVKQLYRRYAQFDQPQPPFDQVADFTAMGGPRWRTVERFDLGQHLFFHRPRQALDEAGLFAMVSRLHEPLMDRSRPMWEFHLIDNVAGGRFAIYSKMHHAYADGVTMSRWIIASLSGDAAQRRLRAIWAMGAGMGAGTGAGTGADSGAGQGAGSERGTHGADALLRRLLKGVDDWRRILLGVSKLVTQLALEQAGLTRNAVSLPFRATGDTPLTGGASGERQFAMARVPMARIQRIRRMTRCTLNHVALACIDGALRRYLADHDIRLQRPLSIHMPVNLRSTGNDPAGNMIGIVLVELAAPEADPYQRLQDIGFTLRAVRNQVDSVPPIAVAQYTAVMAVLLELIELLRLDRLLPAVADTLVSNVPGPPGRLYLEGAALQELVPISTLPPGNNLNITLYSYAGVLHFGLVATPAVERLAILAGYIEQAFEELEQAVFNPPG